MKVASGRNKAPGLTYIIKSDTRQSIESMGFKWFGNFVDVFIPRSFGAAASSYTATQTISTRVFLLYFFFFVVRWGGIDPSARVTRALVIIVNVYRSHGRPLIDPWCLFFLMKPMRRAPFRDRMG